jgi:hypothetical protein
VVITKLKYLKNILKKITSILDWGAYAYNIAIWIMQCPYIIPKGGEVKTLK